MYFTEEKIKHIAKLVRLKLTSEEIKKLEVELESVINWTSVLNEVNTSGIKPLVSVATHSLPIRKDEVKIKTTRNDILKNSPDKDEADKFFTVPKIIE